MTDFPPPVPDPDPPAPSGPLAPTGRSSPASVRGIVALGLAAFLAVSGIVGYEVGRDAPAPVASTTFDVPRAAATDRLDTTARGFDVDAVADRVDDAVVNITTTVERGGRAAGTGIVISSSGLVLTNNHVISGAVDLDVEFGASGLTRSARVLGYSIVDDVALLQVRDVANLRPADLGSSSTLAVGDPIVALGNAGGRGGRPSVAAGEVTGLDEEITASDADGTDARTLDGLIEVAADIRSGDSGGPMADAQGRVVGMSVAASVNGSFGLRGQTAGEGYAIPIEDALAIARKITSGEGGDDIRVGANRAVLGVQVQPELAGTRRLPGTGGGARVVGVESGSGADRAGIATGDVIVAVGGRTVGSTGDLTRALVRYSPGDTVEITWRTAAGGTRTAAVKTGSGPPA